MFMINFKYFPVFVNFPVLNLYLKKFKQTRSNLYAISQDSYISQCMICIWKNSDKLAQTVMRFPRILLFPILEFVFEKIQTNLLKLLRNFPRFCDGLSWIWICSRFKFRHCQMENIDKLKYSYSLTFYFWLKTNGFWIGKVAIWKNLINPKTHTSLFTN